jgi:hypothetical protein
MSKLLIALVSALSISAFAQTAPVAPASAPVVAKPIAAKKAEPAVQAKVNETKVAAKAKKAKTVKPAKSKAAEAVKPAAVPAVAASK